MESNQSILTKEEYEAALSRIYELMQLEIELLLPLANELEALVDQVELYKKHTFRMFDILEAFLALGTPKEQARVDARMMLAAKIDDALKAKGLGLKQFAEMMGERPSVIKEWLSKGHNFRVDTLADVQRVLRIRLLDLNDQQEGT